MTLYLLRHADALDIDSTRGIRRDFERPLSEKGRGQAKILGRWCREQGYQPGLILSSPYVRAKETAEVFAEAVQSRDGAAGVVLDESLGCGMRVEQGAAVIRNFGGPSCEPGGLMLVGHNPDFSALAAFLVGSTRSSPLHVRKSSLACFTLAGPSLLETAVLEWFLPVRLLK